MEVVAGFFSGMANAVASNFAFGAGRVEIDDAAYQAGQAVGDIISVAVGAAEVIVGTAGGAAGAGGGLATCAATAGGGCVAGAGAASAGAVVAAHGVAVVSTATGNGNVGGGNGDDKTTISGYRVDEHASSRMTERNISSESVKNSIENGEKFDYYHEGTWKTGFYDKQSNVFVGTKGDTVTTVIQPKSGQTYIDNLKSAKP